MTVEIRNLSLSLSVKINRTNNMPCAVAMSNSPVFSPSRVPSIFCKPSSSPDNLKLHHLHRSPPTPTPSSSSSPSFFSSVAATPRSPLTLRLFKQINGFNDNNNEDGPGSGLGCSVSGSDSPSWTLLKRKRPAKLEIPIAPLSSAVDTPAAGVERLVEVVDEGEGYSVYCKRGKKNTMEDRYSAFVDLHGVSKQALFGVFDGHGGEKAAEFAAKNMDKYIMAEVTRRCEDDTGAAVEAGYLTTDAEFLKEDVSGGACCVTALIRNGNLVVSNAGDCRAVMSQSGIAEALTSDHKPSRKDEKERIEALGGYVDFCHGIWRIQGSLAVSRGIGDRHLKQWVTAQPETKILKITPECEFVILASDGLWDKVSNQEAVDIVRPLCIGVDRPELVSSACKKLADLSISRGSRDDTSVMVIQLRHFVS